MNTIDISAFGYQARICPERGANLISLTKGGMSALRTPNDMSDFANSNPYLWGVPILLPPNRISGAAFEFEGRKYVFPMNEPALRNFIHGFLHEQTVPCVRHEADEAEFIFHSTREALYMNFPHTFTMRILFKLCEDGLRQRVWVTNDSDTNMPFALGFHTTFRLPFVPDGRAEDIRMQLGVGREIVRNMDNFLPTGEIIEDSPFRQELLRGTLAPTEHTISRHFEMAEREMCLIDVAHKAQIRYRASERYRYWMIYNGGSKDFMCVEPQTWMNNCPNAPFDRTQTGFTYIEPQGTRFYETVFSLETWA